MNTRRIIKELYGKAFDQSYVDTLKAAYKAYVEEGLFTAEEADYSKAVPYLEEHLSSEQKEILKAIEQRYENRWGYATQYPFVCGLMHAFEQFFSRDGLNVRCLLVDTKVVQSDAPRRITWELI